MSRVMVLCATHHDHREIGRLNGARQDTFFFHDYATLALEELVTEESPTEKQARKPEIEIECILQYCREEAIDCIVSTDDYPGSTLAGIVARALGLPGVDPSVNLLCQHKYHARRAQRALVPEATPKFELIDDDVTFESVSALGFPLFIKPVKSFFSVGAQPVLSADAFPAAVRCATLPRTFFDPFKSLLKSYSGLDMQGYVLAEALLEGQQTALEGYAYRGNIYVLGIVDSIMFPGTSSFERFEYPSRLSASVQERMAAEKWPRLFEQLSPIYKWTPGGSQTVQSCPRRRARMAATNAKPRDEFAGLHSFATFRGVISSRHRNVCRPVVTGSRVALSETIIYRSTLHSVFTLHLSPLQGFKRRDSRHVLCRLLRPPGRDHPQTSFEGGRRPFASGTPATRGAHNSEAISQQPDHQSLV